MSDKLNKPYTKDEKLNFIINHQCNYKLEETDEALYALKLNEILVNGEVIVDPDYEGKRIEARKEEFYNQFIGTSLGWVRRKVTMKDGGEKDFLTDIVPALQAGIPIITYNEPDFTKDELPSQNVGRIVTEDFIRECKMQLFKDFYGEDIQ